MYCTITSQAVQAFQHAHGLTEDGTCDSRTWAALVEASWDLGDRLLYHRVPNLRGDDVAELQRRLGRLGFDAGRVDGIFGPLTLHALEDFQRNVGLPPDGICGYETLQALQRLGGRTDGGRSIASVREEEVLRRVSPTLAGKRLVVGDLGGLGTLARGLTKRLRALGAVVLELDEPDGSVQAGATNRFGADLYLGLRATDGPGRFAYYAVPGFESIGGRRLAELLQDHIATVVAPCGPAEGVRLPVLRETRMPAVLCELGPIRPVLDHAPAIAEAVVQAVSAWVTTPLAAASPTD